MKARYLFATLAVIGTSPVLAAMTAAWMLIALLIGLGALAGYLRFAAQAMVDFARVLWDFLRIRGRRVEIVPPALIFPALLVYLWFFGPSIPGQRELFLHEYSSFLQTAAQVLAAMLIALAVEVRAPKSVEDAVAVRPANLLTLGLVALAELASMAALSPLLPSSLDRLSLLVTIAAGVAAIVAIVLVNRRVFSE